MSVTRPRPKRATPRPRTRRPSRPARSAFRAVRGCSTRTPAAVVRPAAYKVPAVWLKRLFGIYGEVPGFGTYPLTPTEVSWTTKDPRLVESLHQLSNGQQLYGYALAVKVIAGTSARRQFDRHQQRSIRPCNGRNVYERPGRQATHVWQLICRHLNRAWSKVETYNFSTGTWTVVARLRPVLQSRLFRPRHRNSSDLPLEFTRQLGWTVMRSVGVATYAAFR